MRPHTRPTSLADLAALLPDGALMGPGDVRVQGICLDSRAVEPGDLFVALPGTQADGHRFAPSALERGAVAILGEDASRAPAGTPYLQAGDGYAALARLASHLYGDPSRGLKVVGVTGTNGKTTVTYLLEAILGFGAGASPLALGTVEYRHGGWTAPSTHTTPDAIAVQALMAERLMHGATHVVMEVSSHALTQRRADGVHFDVGVFTNFSRDHLDYHGTMDAYFEAKARLFTELLGGSPERRPVAVLGVEDPRIAALAEALPPGIGVLRYALDRGAHSAVDLWVESSTQSFAEAVVTLGRATGEAFEVRSPLLGRFNLQNLLGAVGAALSLGLSPEAIQRGLALAPAVPGRLEPVTNDRGIGVFVDYAHTPEALARVLGEMRSFGAGRIFVVFGAGGDRDRGKRAQMAEAAAAGADHLVVTTDNPRTEVPLAIIEDLLAGIPAGVRRVEGPQTLGVGEGPTLWVEQSRRRAIHGAIGVARPGDIVLIAGKGHESYQEVGHTRLPFDDRAVARAALGGEAS